MTNIPIATYIDTVHGSVGSVPVDTKYVGGYTSGTADIQWTDADWRRFPQSIHSRIYQGYGAVPSLLSFDEIDVETGAVSPSQAAELVRSRVISGIQWTTIYGSQSSVEATTALIQAMGPSIWIGHVNVRLANWNLNEQEASAVVGTSVGGATVIGVQWASPSSNPDTLIPGTDVTLQAGNVDLNVVDAYWTPSGGFSIPPIQPPPPGTQTLAGVLVNLPNGAVKRVTSTDGGYTWR